MSLSLICDQFQMKSSNLSRLFKEEFGQNFVDYLAQIRIEQAKLMLKESQEPIQDIAAKIGYSHYISFNRAFKKLTGLTPGDYRK
ncbi:HTH-type transcriptional regulator YesS [compost metagenome]